MLRVQRVGRRYLARKPVVNTQVKIFSCKKHLTTGSDRISLCAMDQITPERAKYLKQFEARRNKMKKLLESGLSYSEAAKVMGVSRQRVRKVAEMMKVAA